MLCKLKDTRKPSFLLFTDVYVLLSRTTCNLFCAIVPNAPLYANLYTTSLKFKTKLTSVYLFSFIQAEYFYEFQTLRSLDKDIMDDPTVNVPLLGSVPHKASGTLLFLSFIYLFFYYCGFSFPS